MRFYHVEAEYISFEIPRFFHVEKCILLKLPLLFYVERNSKDFCLRCFHDKLLVRTPYFRWYYEECLKRWGAGLEGNAEWRITTEGKGARKSLSAFTAEAVGSRATNHCIHGAPLQKSDKKKEELKNKKKNKMGNEDSLNSNELGGQRNAAFTKQK